MNLLQRTKINTNSYFRNINTIISQAFRRRYEITRPFPTHFVTASYAVPGIPLALIS